ncbi:hypothetical protein LMG22931_00227 [Paraburkholderia nemoris]|nr:hypothetical protein LMG22931_00227 [Paraburkholderia nemoris]
MPVRWLFVRVLGALAFPCFVSGLLVLPLCGAALTFFAAAKKDKQRKRLEAPAKWAPWSAAGSGATGIRVLSHSALVTKDSSAPTPHCVRRGRVCIGNHGLRLRFARAIGFASARRHCTHSGTPCETRTLKRSDRFYEWLFGARSAAGSMTPLSQAYAAARTQIPVAPLPGADHGTRLAGASSRFLLPTFLCGGKEK